MSALWESMRSAESGRKSRDQAASFSENRAAENALQGAKYRPEKWRYFERKWTSQKKSPQEVNQMQDTAALGVNGRQEWLPSNYFDKGRWTAAKKTAEEVRQMQETASQGISRGNADNMNYTPGVTLPSQAPQPGNVAQQGMEYSWGGDMEAHVQQVQRMQQQALGQRWSRMARAGAAIKNGFWRLFRRG